MYVYINTVYEFLKKNKPKNNLINIQRKVPLYYKMNFFAATNRNEQTYKMKKN